MAEKLYVVVNEFTGEVLIPVAFRCRRSAEAKAKINRERLRSLLRSQAEPVGFRLMELHEDTSSTWTDEDLQRLRERFGTEDEDLDCSAYTRDVDGH